ncbi:MAG: phosphoribosyl-ATP diphosphatase [Clostridium sp.]
MEKVLESLYSTVLERKNGGEEGSYTSYLFSKGKEKILKKVGEECTEVVISALKDDKEEQINEICDLTYHLMVLIAELNIPLSDIEEELNKRSLKINNFKGERKTIENV